MLGRLRRRQLSRGLGGVGSCGGALGLRPAVGGWIGLPVLAWRRRARLQRLGRRQVGSLGSVAPRAARARARLPQGVASVWIDDKLISGTNTPLKINSLAPGIHSVRVEKEGYRTYKTEIVLKDQPVNNIFTDLIVSQGNLNISIQPWGTIYIDGQLKKKDTNIKYSSVLQAGEHTVKVVHPLYGDWEKVVHVRDGETINLPVNFNNLVNLSVTAFDADGMPIWAEIVVDNKVTGELTPKEISVRVGQRTIAAKKDGYILVSGECKLMLENNFDEPIKFIFKKVL